MSRSEPNLKALLAFEKTAQTESVTKAAEALNVSAGAVSRYISILEADLGVSLFERVRGRMQITSDGNRFYTDVHQALDAIRRSKRLISRRDANTITIWCYPTFASEWLLPRVEKFHNEAGLRISVITGTDVPDFKRSDLAIVPEENLPTSYSSRFLFEERLVPVCSPALTGNRIPELTDVLSLPIASSRYRIKSWKEWVERYAESELRDVTIDFDQSALALRAALEGLGIALATDVFIGMSLARGSLMLPFGNRSVAGDKLYLASETPSRLVSKLSDWIRAEMEDCQRELSAILSQEIG